MLYIRVGTFYKLLGKKKINSFFVLVFGATLEGMNRLSSDVVSALRTDVTITSAPQCVTELVLNSIDAQATAIAVRVDLKLYKLQVIDNGCGISENDLGHLGNRYMTSKCHSLNDLRSNLSSFGFRGEALASLCEVAGMVMITSRPAGSDITYCKIITQGRHQKVVHASRPRPAQGTTILVGDFLYNRPVRRSRIKAAFDLEEIKTHLEYIALIHPQVSLSLRDDATGQMIVETKRSNNVVDTFSSLFGPSIAETLCPVRESSKPFEVTGYISKEAYSDKNLQFIYINKRLVLKSKLHRLVNSIMGRSSILKINNVPHNPISKELNSAFFLAMSPPKRAKHAVYILNIICPHSEYDITLDPKKTLIEFKDWDTILNCIEKLLRNLLEPQVSPEAPVKNSSSVLDEIDRLAREDALAKGSELNADLGARTVVGLPARRDVVIYTPPSQYTQEATTISSDSEKESSALFTRNSEDPFPALLRAKIPYSTSSENPFPTERSSNRKHDFDTTSPETSTTVSTKDFLTMFKHAVFHKKLKHPKPQSKLPVGGPLHFDLNLQKITSMMRPAECTNDLVVGADADQRSNRAILNSLHKFAVVRGDWLSAASSDTVMYHTPVRAQRPSPSKMNRPLDSLADLPYVSELEARPASPTDSVSVSGILVETSPTVSPQIVHVENTETALDDHETFLEKDYANQRTSDVSPRVDALCDSVLRYDKTETPARVLQIPSQDSSLETTELDVTGKRTLEPKRSVENVFPSAKTFMSSEDFLVTLEDVIGISKEDLHPCLPTACTANLLTDSEIGSKDTHVGFHNINESSVLQTDCNNVSCGQPKQCTDNVKQVLPVLSRQCLIAHQQSSEELYHLNYNESLSESQPSSESESKEPETRKYGPILNVSSIISSLHSVDQNLSASGFQFEQNSEESHEQNFSSESSTDPNLPGNSLLEDDRLSNLRKRNAEKPNTGDLDEPVKKMPSLETSDFRNPKNGDTHSDMAGNESDLTKDSNEINQNRYLGDTPKSFSSSGRLKRHSVVLNCSIGGILAVLSPKQTPILKGYKNYIKKTKVGETNEVLKSNERIQTQVKFPENMERKEGTCTLSNKEVGTSRPDEEEVNMEVETRDESLSRPQETEEDFEISSSRDESLVEVLDTAMVEFNDPKEQKSQVTQSDISAVHNQDGDANFVGDDPVDSWEEHADSTGRKYFVHSTHGAIRFHQDNDNSFTMVDRCRFLPKGMSPLVGSNIMSSIASHNFNSVAKDSQVSFLNDQFGNQAGLATAKWPNGKPEDVFEKTWPFVDKLLTTVKPDKEVPVPSAMIQDQSHSQIKVYNVCYPYTFSKDIFNNLRVLGQLDRKFIVTIAKISSPTEQSEVVILFDQHAVHERIRVEELTKEYREVGEGLVWRSAPVHPALPLTLSAREVRVMTNCTDKLRALGLQFSKNDTHSIRITGVPTCLLVREDREVHRRGASVLKSHLESLIREEVDALIQTRGAGVEQPAIIKNVIASEACRGAVKFGHILEREDCQAYLHNLSSCDVPFQCAHGRPALTPIADLSHLPKPAKHRKPNLWKLRRT